jgi:hypothetical protein
MKFTAEEICNELNINISDILNIYPYGSHVYGSNTEFSDHDYIIVNKRSLLSSGAFKDNAISSNDGEIQGTCYSRGGFIDAINTYQMSALECIFLPSEMIVKKVFDFRMNKYNEKEMCKKVVTLASASWHNAILSYKDENFDYVSKNIYHALRILDFGKQIKDNLSITNYSSMNDLKSRIYVDDCKPKDWYDLFIEMSNKLK